MELLLLMAKTPGQYFVEIIFPKFIHMKIYQENVSSPDSPAKNVSYGLFYNQLFRCIKDEICVSV